MLKPLFCSFGLLTILLLIISNTRASANDLCKIPTKVVLVNVKSKLPPAIINDLNNRHVLMAEAGQPYNATDITSSTPSRRFIKGGHQGPLWFVWYEHGGIGNHQHVIGYRLKSRSNSQSQLTDEASFKVNFIGNTCVATIAFLAGVVSATDGDL